MEPALPRLIHFGREICNDLAQAERREWWLANGLGGYAGGTVAGTLTRRYHGLLVAPRAPPLGRALLFAKADATLLRDGRAHPLHGNRWAGGAIEPRGFLNLESFHLDGCLPVWRYVIGDVRLEARIWLESGANTTYLAWRLLSPHAGDVHPRLRVRLLVNARDHHGTSAVGDFDATVAATQQELRVTLPGCQPLRFRSRCGRFTPEHTWIERFDLPAERARGLPDQDNHLCVGELDLPLFPDEWTGFVASLERDPSPYLGEVLRERRQQDASLLRQARVRENCLAEAPAWIEQWVLAACGFLVTRPMSGGGEGGSVIAGYPWFGDWGRDTFIALPGLTLPTHRHDQARRVLETWAVWLDQGLLPNHFPEGGEAPVYHSADAALWYLEAWRAYLDAGGDRDALARHYPALADIAMHYERGTRHGIAVDPVDGLLRAGDADSALTWMDARVDGRPVTARVGKPVELNALWYNALMILADFAHRLGRDETPFTAPAARAREGFQRFRRADGMGLYDVLDGPEGADARLRPNQIFAVSLRHSPLDAATQAEVVGVVGARLLTSCGLRTLEAADPGYRGVYQGDAATRDAAYHQGPAWAWLLPHFALATHRVGGDAARAQSLLEPLADHLADAGLGGIGELFDGDPPHTPRGAPMQAWSVACALQAWCELERARRETRGGHHG